MNRAFYLMAAALGGLMPLLFDSALKGAALLAVALLCALALYRASAAARHLVWLVAVAALLIVPLLSFALPGWRVLPQWTAAPMANPTPALQTAGQGTGLSPGTRSAVLPRDLTFSHTTEMDSMPAESASDTAPATVNVTAPAILSAPVISDDGAGGWREWLPLAWAAGFGLLALRLCAAHLLLRRAARGCAALTEPRDGAIANAFATACMQLGIRQQVQLLLDERRTIPVVWGVFRVRMLLPAEAREWSREQLLSVLLHELAHVKRRDTLAQLITQIACALHWWNPLVWLAAWRMHIERERACDDLVLASGVRPSTYAEHLLHVATKLAPAPWTAACGLAMARKSSLEGRLLAVLSEKLNRRGVTTALAAAALLLGVGIVVPLAMLRAAEPGKPATESDTVNAEPKDARSKPLFESWKTSARSDGKIPGGRIGEMAASLKTLMDLNPGREEVLKVAPLIKKCDASRDWTAAEAAALLDEIAAITPRAEWAMRDLIEQKVYPGKPLPDELAQAPWGKQAENGLRVAWLLEPAAETQALDSVMKSRVLFHNAGKAPAYFATDDWLQSGGHTAKDANGKDIQIFAVEHTRLPTRMIFLLAPGEYAEVEGHGICVGPRGESNEKSAERVGCWIAAKAGDALTFTPGSVPVSFQTWKNNDGLKKSATVWQELIAARVMRESPMPPGASERKQLLRRVMKDFPGAAPTAEEIAAFTNDNAEGALGRLIKSLQERTAAMHFAGELQGGETKFRVIVAAAGAPKRPKLPDEAYTKTGIHCQKFREEDAKLPGGELMGDARWESGVEDRAEAPLVLGLRVARDAKWNIGGQARVQLVVRAASGSDVKFPQTPRSDNGLSVVAIDKDGREHGAEIAQFDGWLTFNHLLLPRSHVVMVKAFTLRFDPDKRGVSEPGVAAFHLPPGDYKLRCTWSDARPEVAHEGEWTGELTSVEHKFTLAAAGAPVSETPKTGATDDIKGVPDSNVPKATPKKDWAKIFREIGASDYNAGEPFDPEELARLAKDPKSNVRRLSWLICRAGAEKAPRFRDLLSDENLKAADDRHHSLGFALAAYDYSVNGNQGALQSILDALAKKEPGSDAQAAVPLGFIDEWDLTVDAHKKHFAKTAGAGAIAAGLFWMRRECLFPTQFAAFQAKQQQEKATPVKGGAQLKPATEQKLKWGEPANGLRMAMAWPPTLGTLGEPGMGDAPEFYLVVQNVSDAAVRFTANDAAPNPRALIMRSNGSPLSAMGDQKPMPGDWLLQPREVAFLRLFHFDENANGGRRVEAVMEESTRGYPNYSHTAEMSIKKAPAGAWTGHLATGETQNSVDVIPPKTGAQLKPATEQKLKWGETVNGLRMALAWPPTLDEPGMGSAPEFWLVVQNVSQAAVRLTANDAAPNPRKLYLWDNSTILSAFSDPKLMPGDWLLLPREAAFLRLLSFEDTASDGRKVEPMMEEATRVYPNYSHTAVMSIEKAPAGAWTGKLATGQTRSSMDVIPPKNKDAQSLYTSWTSASHTDGKIPGALIGALGESVKTFIKSNPTSRATPQLEKMLPRFDASRDWSGPDAVALLDELAAAQSTPISMALDRENSTVIRTGTPLPAELMNAPWGGALPNGLRHAYLLEPRTAGHPLGTPLKARLLIHNAGKEPVVFRTRTWHQLGHKAADAKGGDIKVESTEWTTRGQLTPFRLMPGEFIEVNSPAIGVGARGNNDQWQNTNVGSWINAKAGDEVTVMTEPLPLMDWNENEQLKLDGEPRWWLDHITERLSRHQPFPADADARLRVLHRVAIEVLGTSVSKEMNDAFVADHAPTALDSAALRLFHRPGLHAWAGPLVSAPTKFRVLPADPDAAKKPRTASNPGQYPVNEKASLVVVRRSDRERILNEAHLSLTGAEPRRVKLPDGYNTWAAGWARGGTALWVTEKGLLRKIDFTYPEKVEETRYEADEAAKAPIPADIREALRVALDVPDAPKQQYQPLRPPAAPADEAPKTEKKEGANAKSPGDSELVFITRATYEQIARFDAGDGQTWGIEMRGPGPMFAITVRWPAKDGVTMGHDEVIAGDFTGHQEQWALGWTRGTKTLWYVNSGLTGNEQMFQRMSWDNAGDPLVVITDYLSLYKGEPIRGLGIPPALAAKFEQFLGITQPKVADKSGGLPEVSGRSVHRAQPVKADGDLAEKPGQPWNEKRWKVQLVDRDSGKPAPAMRVRIRVQNIDGSHRHDVVRIVSGDEVLEQSLSENDVATVEVIDEKFRGGGGSRVFGNVPKDWHVKERHTDSDKPFVVKVWPTNQDPKPPDDALWQTKTPFEKIPVAITNWSAEQDGLRIGMRVVAEEGWRIGGKVKVELWAHNPGAKDVWLIANSNRSDVGLMVHARDSEGRDHHAANGNVMIIAIPMHCVLPAGYVAKVKDFTLSFDAPDNKETAWFEPKFQALEPGKYKLRCAWSDPHPLVSTDGEWTGVLTTGEHEFTLLAQGAPE